ncbi:MAG: vWA domain-containing protein [Wenzhouxiangellaceae bacterium]
MDRRNRPGLTFSLSFLDVMSVGLGSVILIFLIINHASQVVSREATVEQAETLERAQAEFDAREATAEALARALEAREEQLRGARARLAELQQLLAGARQPESDSDSREALDALRSEVLELERSVADLRRENIERQSADSVFSRAGEGRRQYLTGLRVDGARVLILLDISASMLAETIVGAIRLRNMDRAAWAEADKWQRALESAEWMAAQLVPGSQFQIYTFNEQARSVLGDSTGRWLEVGDGSAVADALREMRQARPGGGTSLYNAFRAAAALSPPPDEILLITDHTPTAGAGGAGRGRVSPERRLRLFSEAARQLPPGAAVNVILLPMEGDPMAAAQFWQLSNVTGGVMLSPASDWP